METDKGKSKSKKPDSDDQDIDNQEPSKEGRKNGGDSSDDEAAVSCILFSICYNA